MFPFRGYLRHGTHPHNLSTPPTTTKTHSAQKDKIKPCIQHLRYLYTSENTEIQLTPVDKLGQDQTSLSPSVTSILPVLHFRAESLCTHRALYGYLVSIPKTARSQVQTTQLHSRPTAHPHSTANAPHPQRPCFHMGIMPHRTRVHHLACRSTPDVFAREVPTYPSAQLSEPDIQEYPTYPTSNPP